MNCRTRSCPRAFAGSPPGAVSSLAVLVLAAVMCSCADPEPSPCTEGWDCWVEIDGLAAPYPTAEVVAEMQSRIEGDHVVLLPSPVDFSDATELASIVADADSILEDGYALRDNPVIDVSGPIDWGANPRADANWHYQVNALRPVEPLFAAFAITGEVLYYEVAAAVVLDWIDYNIAADLPNDKKWNDMATGIRAVLIANVLDYELRRGDALVSARLYELVRAAAMHLEVLRDPEMFALSNHGLFMILGLRALLDRAPELRGADAAADYANQQLDALIDTQFSSEYMHLEHSPSYHVFVGELFADLAATGLFDDQPRLRQVAEGAASHYHELLHPNGDIVLIGDSGGSGHRALTEECRYVVSGGQEGTLPEDRDGYYPEAGIAAFRSSFQTPLLNRQSFLYFQAAFHSVTHAHADFFTFEWSELRMPIIVDSGKYGYAAGEWRNFFESTRAGNTVEIDGLSFNTYEEPPFGSALTGWGCIEDGLRFVEASARRELANTQHTRMLVFREGHWLVVIDRLNAPEVHSYRQWFGFHEDIEVDQTDDGFHAVLPLERGEVFVQDLDPVEPDGLELAYGREGEDPQGWISRSYLEKQPRFSAAFRRTGTDVTLVTILSLHAPVSNRSLEIGPDRLRFSFTSAASEDEAFEYTFGETGGEVRRYLP